MIRPTRHSSHHHGKRFTYKPRHRYSYPLGFYPDMTVNPLRRHKQTRTQRLTNSNFQDDMLKLHNNYRARHCAPPLVISQRLNQIAQSYAEHLAATSTFEHSGNQLENEPLGENLYMQWITFGRAPGSAREAVKGWYDEISMHNFQRPKFSPKTGHFTQLVWKSSKKLGVGIAYSPDRRGVYVVANYYPAGNIMGSGSFEKNVLPPNC
ncbi:unnamed protein product [Rotaria sp. Silwood2]|nr:unnamed protein product [Rotaria sp. Silwood2]